MALYQTQPDRKLRAKALAKEYGIGGHSHDFLDGSRGFVNHDWKGLEFDHYPDHQKITLKWAQVEKYIDLMIQSDRYLTDEEKEQRTTVQEENGYKVGDDVMVDLPTGTIEGTIGYIGETDVRIDTSAHGQSWDNEVINKRQFEDGLRQNEPSQRVDEMLEQRGVEIPIKHLNNSAGIMRLGGSFNMVRAGIILYGLYPSEEVDKSLLPLQPVLRWVARVSHVKTLEPGREISYGGTYTTPSPRRVATIPVGYADGYPRCLSGMGQVLIGGKRAPILGRVCMDQFMVDVTEIPGVQVGTPVTLVGTDGNETLSMEEVSGLAHSFNYELPCRIARRVPRVYYRDGVPVDAVEYIPV